MMSEIVSVLASCSISSPMLRGNRMSTVVPSPSVLDTEICPPDCLTKPNTIDSPRPVPCPSGLVVKNGSNVHSSVSGVMPAPVSEADRRTYSPGRRSLPSQAAASSTSLEQASVNLPSPRIASRALMARFSSAFSSWLRSTQKFHGSAGNMVAIVTDAPTACCSSSRSSSKSRRGLITTGESGWRRANDSSCDASFAPRCTASSAACTRSGTRLSVGGRYCSSCWLPLIACSVLLKSCATPPVIAPSASIFRLWRSCASIAMRADTASEILS